MIAHHDVTTVNKDLSTNIKLPKPEIYYVNKTWFRITFVIHLKPYRANVRKWCQVESQDEVQKTTFSKNDVC